MVKYAKKTCGAKTRSGGVCKNPPMENGRCRLHGGTSTGPTPGAVTKTGEIEAIWFGLLTDEEKELYHAVNMDALTQISEELRLISIREFRMIRRQAKIAQDYDELEDYITTERIKEKGITNDKLVGIMKSKETLVMQQLQEMEEAITRIQDKKQKLIELKHKIESGGEATHVDIDLYVQALNGVAGDVWSDEDDEEIED